MRAVPQRRAKPVVGHLKAEHRMDRSYLKSPNGDRHQRGLGRGQLQLQLAAGRQAKIFRTFISALAPTILAAQVIE